MLEWGSITKGLVGTTAWLTLEVERPIAHYLPWVPDSEMTVADLVHHTSGLPRLPATMRDRLFGDPYRESVGVPLDLAAAVPATPRGQFVYSNLGYALLGAVLDEVHGDWFAAVRQHVLDPAGISSAALVPADSDRVVPKLFGRAIQPWALGEPSFAAAGGVWSTFDGLCRYASSTNTGFRRLTARDSSSGRRQVGPAVGGAELVSVSGARNGVRPGTIGA